jgi:serine/threonine-protein kinase
MLPLLDALDAAHRAGVVHRDLKPDNVFILPAVRGVEPIKILDFGISQKADEIEHHLTQEGAVLGTPHYMSPEQARGESGVDARADLYSAGVLLYECVVGDVPFDAGNYNALLQIILSKPPQSPRARGAQITSPVEQVLLAALHKDKRKRPESARALHDILLEASTQPEDATLDGESWSFRRSSPASGAGQGAAPSKSSFSLEGPPSGVRRAPEGEGNSPRESGEFDFAMPAESEDLPLPEALPVPEPSGPPPRVYGKPVPPPPAAAPAVSARAPEGPPRVLAPAVRVPPPPGPSIDRVLPLPLPAGGPRSSTGPAPLTVSRAPLPEVVALQPLPGLAKVPTREQNLAAAPRTKKARVEEPEESEPEGPSGLARFGRALAGWVLALVAMAALAYVATLVFNRPDPRKARRTPPSQGLGSESTP